jgi:hypothetical protein
VVLAALVAPATPALAEQQPELRQVARPIAIYDVLDDGTVHYDVYVRLNRAIPREPWGSLVAAIRLAGLGPTEPPTGDYSNGFFSLHSNRGRYCYGQSSGAFPLTPMPPDLQRPTSGQLVATAVLVKGYPGEARRWTRLRPLGKRVWQDRRLLEDLGCLRPRSRK